MGELSDAEAQGSLERLGDLLRDDAAAPGRHWTGSDGRGDRGAGSEPASTDAQGGTRDAAPLLHGYRLIAPLGQGGQGSVWRAVHEPSGRAAAIKIVRFAGAQQRARMQREAKLASGLRHPGIVSIFDCGALPDAGFAIAMELVEGAPLDQWARAVDGSGQDLRQRTRRKARVMSRVAAALHHAHQLGVIHRDLKPANILVGADDQPRVVDFGLARAAAGESGQTVTRSGEFAGTLAYAAPEQLGAGPPVGTAADIYALGAVLHETLVGTPPVECSGSIEQVVAAVLHAEVREVRRSARGEPVDRDLLVVARKALEKDPHRRYESAAALRGDLDRWLAGQPVEARRSSRLYVFGKLVRRHWMATILAALAAATLLAFAVVVTHLYLQADEARQRFEGLFERAQETSDRLDVANRNATAALLDLTVANQQERQARLETAAAGRRLAASLAASNLARARELAAHGDLDAARALAWRELLSPSLLVPGAARVGSPRFEAALATLRAIHLDEAAGLGLSQVDELLVAELEPWIERLAAAGVEVTNVQPACMWLEARRQEVEAGEASRGGVPSPVAGATSPPLRP